VTDAELDSRLHQLESRWRADPSSRLFLQLAEELRRAGRHAEASRVLEQGLAIHPDTISALVALGRCRLDDGDPRRAAEALSRAVELDPSQWVANKLLVEAWIRLGEPQRAAERLAVYRLVNDRDAESEALAQRIDELRASSGAEPFALDRTAPPPPLELRAVRRAARSAAPFGEIAGPQSGARILDYFTRQGIFVTPNPAVPAGGTAAAPSDGEIVAVTEVEPRSTATTSATAAEEDVPRFSMRYIGEEVEREVTEGPTGVATPAAVSAAPLLREADEDAILEPHGSATLAALYLRQGHLEEAEQQYRTVLQAKPGAATALAGLEEIRRRRAAGSAEVEIPAVGLTQRKVKVLRDLLARVRRGRERHVS